MISLRSITWENWEECYNLEVAEEQKGFLASNRYSLAQSYVALLNDKLPPMTFAIYEGETMVGFAMMGYEAAGDNEYGDEPAYWLVRFMIEKRQQKRGLGSQAMELVLQYLEGFPQGAATAVYLGYDTKNEVARRFYHKFGFRETGVIAEDEAIAVLWLPRNKTPSL